MALRILFVSFEIFNAFSGNGTYSQLLARELTSRSSKCAALFATPGSNTEVRTDEHGMLHLPVPVSSWKRLDWKGPWSEYDELAWSTHQKRIVEFQPDAVVFVDWHTVGTVRRISEFYNQTKDLVRPKFVYMNFRVFGSATGSSPEEQAFYTEEERLAYGLADRTVLLSSTDELVFEHQLDRSIPPTKIDHRLIRTVAPAVRDEILHTAHQVPMGTLADQSKRKYFTSCVRVSKEKNLEFFVALIREMAPFFREHGIVPYMCGVASTPEYGRTIRDAVRESMPESLIEEFVTADRLCEIYQNAVMNVHAATIESYGLTMVEAAAFGCPSLVNARNIGCTDLLTPGTGCFTMDFENTPISEIGERLRTILGDHQALHSIAVAGREKALSYDSSENGKRIYNVITELMSSSQ